jgi:hypothetical protein
MDDAMSRAIGPVLNAALRAAAVRLADSLEKTHALLYEHNVDFDKSA